MSVLYDDAVRIFLRHAKQVRVGFVAGVINDPLPCKQNMDLLKIVMPALVDRTKIFLFRFPLIDRDWAPELSVGKVLASWSAWSGEKISKRAGLWLELDEMDENTLARYLAYAADRAIPWIGFSRMPTQTELRILTKGYSSVIRRVDYATAC